MAKRRKQKPSGIIRVIGKRGVIDVSTLLKEGVVTSLSLSRWRAEQRLLPQDLCLDGVDSSVMQRYVVLGKKSLIPPSIQRKLNTIESSARYAIKRYGLETPFGTFITAAAYPELEKEMNRFEKEWMDWGDKLAKQMRANQTEVREAYKSIANELYAQLKNQEANKSKFAKSYAKRIVKGIPTAQEVKESFRFEFQVFYVPMPAILDRKIKQQVEAEIINGEKVKTAITKEQKARQMNELIAARYEKRKEEMVDKFLNGVNTQVRGMVHTVVSSALESLDKNSTLVGKTAGQLQNMIKRFRMLNILDDNEIESQIERLETELAKAPKERKGPQIERVLSKLRTIATETALDLRYNHIGRTPRGELFGEYNQVDEQLNGIDVASRANRELDLSGLRDM